MGPVGSDGLIVREESVKARIGFSLFSIAQVAGGWAAGSQLQWVRGIENQ